MSADAENTSIYRLAPPAVVLMLTAVFGFALIEAMAKGLSGQFPPGEITFFRMAFGALPPLVFLIIKAKGLPDLRTSKPLGHAARALSFVFSFFLFVAALPFIDLAQAATLSYTEVLMIGPLSWLLLKERITRPYLLAAPLGFAGTVLVLDPTSGVMPLGAGALVLLSALFGALGVVQVRRLGATEEPAVIAFYLSVIASGIALLSLPFGWTLPTAGDLALLFLIGLIGGTAQLMMTAAFKRTAAAALHPFVYTGLIWAAFFGWLFFGESLTGMTVIGAGIIIAAAVIMSRSK